MKALKTKMRWSDGKEEISGTLWQLNRKTLAENGKADRKTPHEEEETRGEMINGQILENFWYFMDFLHQFPLPRSM